MIHHLMPALAWLGDPTIATALLAAAVALLVAALAGFPVRRLARRVGAIDVPGGRHIHRAPTPRLGGLAVLAGVAAAVPLGFAALVGAVPEALEQLRPITLILVVGTLVSAIGAVDDVKSLSPQAKLFGLGIAGLLLALGGVRIDHLALPGLGCIEFGPWLAAAATVVWVLACTNAVNLIDGVDGLGAGVSLVASATMALVAHGTGDAATAVAFVAIGGACGGFLLHNREPARLFLGDSGSLLLGYLLAAFSANGCTKRAAGTCLVVALLTLAVPLLDSTQAFLRRLHRARSQLGPGQWLAKLKATAVGDREHIHHRLLGRGHSHRRVARTLSLCAALPGLSGLLLLPGTAASGVAVAGALLASGWVLWRLAAMPSALKTPPTTAEKDLVLPSRPPRRAPRADPARQVERV